MSYWRKTRQVKDSSRFLKKTLVDGVYRQETELAPDQASKFGEHLLVNLNCSLLRKLTEFVKKKEKTPNIF